MQACVGKAGKQPIEWHGMESLVEHAFVAPLSFLVVTCLADR